MPKAILFDLDGTLVQTRDSSWHLFSKTNKAFGLGVRTQDEYFKLLENNLFTSLRDLAGDEELYRKALAHFMNLLRHEYNPPLVPGMVDVIKSVAGVCSLAVVSSNATETIRRILTNAGLQHCFSHVFGGDVEPDKRACVRRFLSDPSYSVNRRCVPAYLEAHRPDSPSESQVILVTDTVGDVRHAVECGIRTVGVSWGMHSEEELLKAGAEFVAIWPQEIVAHLFPSGIEAPSCSATFGFVGHQHEGVGSFDRVCDCFAGTETSHRSSTGGGRGCECSSGVHGASDSILRGELDRSNGIRRNRNRAAIEALYSRLETSGSVNKAGPEMQVRANDVLISSLARIRGAQTQAG